MLAKGYSIKGEEYITTPEHRLNRLKRLNIFIGPNNSGKSRLMREMFQESWERYFFYSIYLYRGKLKQVYESLFPKYQNNYGMSDLQQIIDDDGIGNYATRYNAFISRLNSSSITRTSQTIINGRHVWDKEVASVIKDTLTEKKLPKEITRDEIIAKHIYIPIIRGVRKLDGEDMYKDRTITDYKFQLDETHEVFTGQTVYEEIKRMLLGNKRDRKLITDFEKFLSDNFFDSRGVTLVADYEENIVKIDIGDGEEFRAIHEVGDGIQSIIVCCFPAFKNRLKETRLYIEEPELTMHPSVQRVLMEVLINKFPKLQTFITTHSNHFLDLVYDYENDVAIYTLENELKSKKERFLINNATDYSRIIDLIGLRNSSVFLANCVVWTEGVTDRMLLRKLVKMKYGSTFKEDYHYTFSEYGGLNLENYDFANEQNVDTTKTIVSAVSKRNLVIVDNDLNETGNSKDNRIKRLKQVLGRNGVYDKYIEIENLIPFDIWVKVITKIIERSEKIGYQLQKNIEKKEEVFNSELSRKKIGELLKTYVIEYKNKTKPPKYSQTNTISCLMHDKKTIMNIVLEVIEENEITLEELGEGAKTVVTTIGKFISSNNINT